VDELEQRIRPVKRRVCSMGVLCLCIFLSRKFMTSDLTVVCDQDEPVVRT
jgi:hypothetical protein